MYETILRAVLGFIDPFDNGALIIASSSELLAQPLYGLCLRIVEQVC